MAPRIPRWLYSRVAHRSAADPDQYTYPAMPHRRFIPTLLFALAASASLTGCSFYSSADPNRGTLALVSADLPSDTWPVRTTGELLLDLDATTPDSVSFTIPYRSGSEPHADESGDDSGSGRCRLRAPIIAHGVHGRGLVREFGQVVTEDGSTLTSDSLIVPTELLGGLQFVSLPRSAGLSTDNLRRLRDEQPDRYRRFLHRRLGLRQGPGDTWTLAARGTRMRLYHPTDAFSGKVSRGLVIHLSSLAGLEFELPIVKELNRRGWAVLIINASTARRDEPSVYVNPDTDLSQPSARLASMIDNRVAEIAYAAEAGVEFIAEHYPLVQTGNLAVIGYSAGALTAPAVAELLSERVSALVLVGGGANLLDISQRSSLTNGGIELAWKNDFKVPSVVQQLNDAYLSKTKLDPYVLAPRLCNKPVLMLHGAFDDIVPSDTGELLRQRLCSCECYTFTLGHRGIFFFLPGQAGRIANWLDLQTGVSRAGTIRP